ncbi:MAG: hypothetical protein EP329_05955 [Deltaproteobacteria bacterium]|nr:MAG: hypothetical protein EP329_05955 [Deltaproteobacteria bacterium]
MRRLIIVMLALPVFACADTSTPQITISGTAYTFGTPDPVEGAEVHVAELPKLTTTTDVNGYWELEVPEGATVTPWVTDSGHVAMYAQTYVDVADDIDDIYFQMVKPFTFDALAAVLGVTPDPEKCQLASTVNEKAIQGLTFEEFRTHGPHGVAGATVTIDPPVVDVVYFNESVIPDRTLTESSRDGGVVWTNLDPGVYTLRATHPDKAFAEVTVTCEPGRFINASPPQGLFEL